MTGVSARQWWTWIEPVHAVTYFDPAAEEPLQRLGIESFWARYVLKRAAALGPVGPAVVTSAFYVFHPRRAAAVLPDAWSVVAPRTALAARADGVRAALGDSAGRHDVTALADLLWPVAQAADCSGRVLAAAEQAVPRPDDPLLAAWQAMTTLREHRGSGHVAALVAHGVGPVASMQLKAAAGDSVGEDLRRGRAWSEADWSAGWTDLRERGWLSDEAPHEGLDTGPSDQNGLSDAGRAVVAAIEQATDDAAEQPWRTLGEADSRRVRDILAPWADDVWAAGHMPERNPIGVPRVA